MTLSWIIIDFAIDIFVTVRLVIVLTKANKNKSKASTASARTNMRGKNTLFTAVMWWAFIRVVIATLLNVITTIDVLKVYGNDSLTIPTLNFIVCVAMSYVITYDRDIVKNLQN